MATFEDELPIRLIKPLMEKKSTGLDGHSGKRREMHLIVLGVEQEIGQIAIKSPHMARPRSSFVLGPTSPARRAFEWLKAGGTIIGLGRPSTFP